MNKTLNKFLSFSLACSMVTGLCAGSGFKAHAAYGPSQFTAILGVMQNAGEPDPLGADFCTGTLKLEETNLTGPLTAENTTETETEIITEVLEPVDIAKFKDSYGIILRFNQNVAENTYIVSGGGSLRNHNTGKIEVKGAGLPWDAYPSVGFTRSPEDIQFIQVLPHYLSPNGEYTLRIKSGLSSKYGQTLPKDYVIKFKTAPEHAADEYQVEVSSGRADHLYAKPGETVTLEAYPVTPGFKWSEWHEYLPNESTEPVSMADKTAETTTFTMPARDVSFRVDTIEDPEPHRWLDDGMASWQLPKVEKMAGSPIRFTYEYDESTNTGTGTGTEADPYRIPIYKHVDAMDPPYTAPRWFWTDTVKSDIDSNVVFENTDNNTKDGMLIYSYHFEDKNMNPSSWPADPDNQDQWVDAFRFSPYCEVRNDNGTLKFATAYKGSFDHYWTDFEYKLNVAELTKDYPLDRVIHVGDTVQVSYYGNGDSAQTSRGSDYTVNFNVVDQNYNWEKTVTVDQQGCITLSGKNMLVNGGNYKVEKVAKTPVQPEEVKLFSPVESKYAGTGTDADPYRILVYRVPGKRPPNTAPSAFWKGVPDGPDHADLNVVFENTDDNTQTGSLLYSYQFDYSDKAPENWDTQFTKAFRFSPYTEYDNANGTLRFGHGWKGDYSTYWNDWTYKLNVAAITADAPADQQLKAGDRVIVTHTGDYLAAETNRGGNYTVNLDSTTNTEAAGYAPYVTWAHEMEVGADGFLTFSGKDMLVYGGNYKIEKAAAPVEDAITDAGRSLSLEGKIYINQYAQITGFEGVDVEQAGGLLVWNSPVTEENATVENAEVNKPGLSIGENGYYQRTDGIASAQYADTLYLRIYVRNTDGTYVYGPLKEYSVRTYCESRISKNTSIKDTCVALLHYGAAAQLYFHYNIHDLANKNIAADYPSKAWNPDYLTPLLKAESTLTASDLVRSTGKSLSLEGSILVNFYFDTDVQDVKSSELLVWESNAAPLSEENVSYRTALNKEGDLYRAESREFVSCHYGKTIFVCAKFVDQAGNVYYSETMAYSPETYAANKISQNTNPELVDTVKKMVMYGEEAQKYFNK